MKPYYIYAQPIAAMRYPTVGDYFTRSDVQQVVVAAELTPVSAHAVLHHEMLEKFLCEMHGIREQDIDAWDMAHPDDFDPGSVLGCPYYAEHAAALAVEHLVVMLCGADWSTHDASLAAVVDAASRGAPISDTAIEKRP